MHRQPGLVQLVHELRHELDQVLVVPIAVPVASSVARGVLARGGGELCSGIGSSGRGVRGEPPAVESSDWSVGETSEGESFAFRSVEGSVLIPPEFSGPPPLEFGGGGGLGVHMSRTCVFSRFPVASFAIWSPFGLLHGLCCTLAQICDLGPELDELGPQREL